MMKIGDIGDDSIQGIHAREKRYEEMVRSSGYLFGKLLADAWCGAFMWKKSKSHSLPYPITHEIFCRIEKNPHSCEVWMKDEILRLSEQYQFFHWHLEFPDVFKELRINNYQLRINEGDDHSYKNYQLKTDKKVTGTAPILNSSFLTLNSNKYATKAVILEIYDRMKKAMETGTPYETILTPPPAGPSRAHPKI